jgi:glycosyltransferase involved in cell wall biosynthesis
MRRILMIAYHFPPLRGSSGVQRTLRFARHLREYGWEPLILTAEVRAYAETAEDQVADIPEWLHVCRAFALDTARHLAFRNRYPAFLARPDRWKSWWLGAVPAGLGLVRRFAPDILWSTYPIATAHAIGGTLQRLTGLPWVAEFRDPMAQPGYPSDRKTWLAFKTIEERAAACADRLVFTTPSAESTYRRRYPQLARDRFETIENGYDEESFPVLGERDRTPLAPGMLTILHSGIVYPEERDPAHLMQALRRLLDQGVTTHDRVRIRFRAPVHERLLRELATAAGVERLIEIMPPLDYRAALEEMQRADALLVLQAANCNEQIPAKLYEYFRAQRPILALTAPDGDTASALRAAGLDAIAPLDDAAAIAALLEEFVRFPKRTHARIPDNAVVFACSRRQRTAQLARVLDALHEQRKAA